MPGTRSAEFEADVTAMAEGAVAMLPGVTSRKGEIIEGGRSDEPGRLRAPVRCRKGRNTCSNEDEAEGEGEGETEDGEAEIGIEPGFKGFGDPAEPAEEGEAPTGFDGRVGSVGDI